MKSLRAAAFSILLTIPVAFSSCSAPAPNGNANANSSTEKSDKKKKHETEANEAAVNNATNSTANNGACDASLWKHVYNPDRLEVQKDCVTATGTIAERNTDEDGDEHMLLTLDPDQEDLINKRNKKKKDGNLVVEAVCAGPTQLKKVGDTCKDFSNSVYLPQVGEKVRVTGSFVLDGHNGWTEIHPVSRIERIK